MSRTGSGISMCRSVETSCAISAIGKSGARSSGPIGWCVPGCNGGASGSGRSAAMLYHEVGMRSSSSKYFVLAALNDDSSIVNVNIRIRCRAR